MQLMKIFKMVFSDFISRVMIKARNMRIADPKCLKVSLFSNDRTNCSRENEKDLGKTIAQVFALSEETKILQV